ncbi:DNA polymerase III subunit alpha [Candidatus Sumerlaeota bacterium]|nr:DNA polymerase III subunit alpha [Candidatus Sumerlaeota bacterium]
MDTFIHLHCASFYSLLRGTFSPGGLIDAARRADAPAVALTDFGGLYGAGAFHTLARESGVRPIYGASFPTPAPGSALVVLARDATGYAGLCRLITRWHLGANGNEEDEETPGREGRFPPKEGPWKNDPAYLADLIRGNQAGVIVLTSDPDILESLRPDMGPESLYVEYFQCDRPSSRRLLRQLVDVASHLGLRGVATNRVHFLSPSDYEVHRTLSAIRTRKTLDTLAEADSVAPTCHFASAEEMQRRFVERPDAVRATHDVAEQCHVDLPVGRNRMPRFEPEDGSTPEEYLRRLCEEAVPRLYAADKRPATRARLDYELDVICPMGYASYFLVVWDVVRFARDRGIPSTGRGSAADSLVSYLLGLTHVDPIAHNLYFERFLNRERSSPPDIDIDLCWRRRDEAVDYVYRRWGADRVAMISTHVTFAGRSCVREVGKAMGLSESEIGRYTRFLPHWGAIDFDKIRAERPESRGLDFEGEPMRSVVPMARRIEGFPWHLGLHPSGIVVSPEPLERWVPLERATKGLVVTQYDMYPIEDLGLLKIDLLGQRSLSVIADVTAQVRQERDPDFGFETTNAEADPGTRDRIAAGRTMGVFQIESPSMRGVLKKVQARDFETVTAASSVIRPGPKDSGMLQSWVRRHLGREPVRFLHPRLEEVLSETHGIMIYQEDVLKVVQAVGGMSLGRADQMRRSMSDKRPERPLASMEREFLDGAVRSGVRIEAAREIWRQMRAFAGYAFCKAHSASYTVLSFRSAYLKEHYPAEFMAAVLANGGGYYDRAAYVSEARRMGLRVLLPSVNRSEKGWTGRDDWVLCGLDQVKGLKEKTIETLLDSRRAKGPFVSFHDALERLGGIEKGEWENLILCGACDGLLLSGAGVPPVKEERGQNAHATLGEEHGRDAHATRPQLLWILDRWFGAGPGRRGAGAVGEQIDLFVEDASRPSSSSHSSHFPAPDLPDFAFERLYDDEVRILEVAIRCHPLERFRAVLPDPARAGLLPASALDTRAGRRARLVGWLVTSRRVKTSRGSTMKFLSLEDETDIYEAVLFDKAYQRYGHLTLTRGPYLVEGRVDDREGHCSLRIDRLELLNAGRAGSFLDVETGWGEPSAAIFPQNRS